MELFRDVMDKEIVDREGFKAGKVDDILLELRPGQLPVVAGIITQNGALARLLGPWTEAALRWLRRYALGLDPKLNPLIIGWEHVESIDVVVQIDLDRWKAGLMDSERAVWQRWIRHLPFARR